MGNAIGIRNFAGVWPTSAALSAEMKSELYQALRGGGEGGIRTHGARKGTPHFECGAFDHSATSPEPAQGP